MCERRVSEGGKKVRKGERRKKNQKLKERKKKLAPCAKNPPPTLLPSLLPRGVAATQVLTRIEAMSQRKYPEESETSRRESGVEP